MRVRLPILIAVLAASVFAAVVARADNVAVIVVPGKRGVPVIINGRDASWSVVDGDFGLYRPGHVYPTIVPLRPYASFPWRRASVARHPVHRRFVHRRVVHWRGAARPHGYFPSTGIRPRVGRRESSSANSGPPRPAQDFFRSWSNGEGPPVPADLDPPAPVNVMPLIQPRIDRPHRKKP